jgi:hypothetical protein
MKASQLGITSPPPTKVPRNQKKKEIRSTNYFQYSVETIASYTSNAEHFSQD